MNKVSIKTQKPYEVYIGSGIMSEVGRLLAEIRDPQKVCVICDRTVGDLYLKGVTDCLLAQGFDTYSFTFAGGEESKSLETAGKIESYLSECKFSRKDIIVALGGGVCGDLAGFAASIYERGIDYVQVPTTVLAAVDSSVGGKTAVNMPQGKNLVGAFHQPCLVVCDTESFKTLPHDVFVSGLAEAIKCGVIGDRQLFETLENCSYKIEELVARCVCLKARIVEEDEKDEGKRAVLNLGHTIAHAVEKLSNYEFSHGEAVAVGLYAMAKAADNRKLADRIFGCLTINGLPCMCDIPPQEIAAEIERDKKASGGKIKLVVPLNVGDCAVIETEIEEAKEFIIHGLEN